VLNHSLTEIGQIYGASLNLRRLTPEESTGIVLFSTWLCWLGAWLSVQRHLVAVDPV
jgi:hypothetical protein